MKIFMEKTALFAIAFSLVLMALGCSHESEDSDSTPPITYTISYKSERAVTEWGGYYKTKTVQKDTLLSSSDLPTVSANGYTFNGWYIENTKIEAGYKVTSDITLTANWTKTPPPSTETYTISYSTEHGTPPENATITKYSYITSSHLPTLSADGYAFDGWYIGEKKISSLYQVTSDITLTAKWTKLYTVSYTTEYGTAPESASVKEGSTLYDYIPTLTTDGYEFDGWYIGDTKMTLWNKVTSDITLTAKWTKLYTVSYSTAYGTMPETQTVREDFSLGFRQLPFLDEDGYEFNGWYSGDTKIEMGYKVTSDITLTAKWTPIPIEITFYPNSSVRDMKRINPSLSDKHEWTLPDGETTLRIKLPKVNYACAGYTFKNWTTTSYGTGDSYEDEAEFTYKKGDSRQISLYAQWTSSDFSYAVNLPKSEEEQFSLEYLDGKLQVNEKSTPSSTSYAWYVDGEIDSTVTGSEFDVREKLGERGEGIYTVMAMRDGYSQTAIITIAKTGI